MILIAIINKTNLDFYMIFSHLDICTRQTYWHSPAAQQTPSTYYSLLDHFSLEEMVAQGLKIKFDIS